MVAIYYKLRPLHFYFFPLEPELPVFAGLDLGGLFPRFPPEGLPVVLGAFFNPLDFAIILGFYINNGSNIYGMF